MSDAIATAQYQLSVTLVTKCVAVHNTRRLSDGLEVPDFRQVAKLHSDLSYSRRGPLVSIRYSSRAVIPCLFTVGSDRTENKCKENVKFSVQSIDFQWIVTG